MQTDIVDLPTRQSTPSNPCNTLEQPNAASVSLAVSSPPDDRPTDHLEEKPESKPIVISTSPINSSTNLSTETPMRSHQHLAADGTDMLFPLDHDESLSTGVPLPAFTLPVLPDAPVSPSTSDASSALESSDAALDPEPLSQTISSTQLRNSSLDDPTAHVVPQMSSIGVQTRLAIVKRGTLAHMLLPIDSHYNVILSYS